MSKRTTLEDFIAGCRKKHPNKSYDYSGITEFSGMREKINVVCPDHGPFSISAIGHYYQGKGCEFCGRLKKGDRRKGPDRGSAKAKLANYTASFLDRVRAVHGDEYDYSQAVYVGAKKPITVICRKHGPFVQLSHKHVMGNGCWDCGQKSAAEKELYGFVASIAPDAVRRDRTVIKPKEIDIWIPGASLALEYCGLYYHSTVKLSKATAQQKHVVKYKAATAKGIRLLTIFEDEWRDRRPQIEMMIGRAVKPGPTVGARRCSVVV